MPTERRVVTEGVWAITASKAFAMRAVLRRISAATPEEVESALEGARNLLASIEAEEIAYESERLEDA